MAAEILVLLKRQDRIEEIIPYLEEVPKPGMRIVFLIPYPVGSSLFLRDYWVTTESPSQAMMEGRKIMERYSWQVQMGLAEQRISVARKALRDKGLEIAVDIYTGSVRRVIEDYAANGDVHLIMMRAGSGHPLIRFLGRTISPFGLFKKPSPPPVLLLHPH